MKEHQKELKTVYLKPEIEIIGMEVETPMLAKSPLDTIRGRGMSAGGSKHDFEVGGSYTFGDEEW